MNSRIVRLILILIGVGVVAVAAFLAYTWIAGGDATPTGDLAAPTLEASGQDSQETVSQSGNTQLFRIEQRDSQVTFTLQEDLRGERNTVIGRSDQVAGDIRIDFDNPAASQLGTIRINARTLVTDNEFRNRALRSNILQSAKDEFEFIEFVPTALTGLPESASIGESYTFEIAGDLTIIDATHPVTFTATITLDSETHITGTASASVMYADWGIAIPDAPGIANVTDDVTLSIEFAADAISE